MEILIKYEYLILLISIWLIIILLLYSITIFYDNLKIDWTIFIFIRNIFFILGFIVLSFFVEDKF